MPDDLRMSYKRVYHIFKYLVAQLMHVSIQNDHSKYKFSFYDLYIYELNC